MEHSALGKTAQYMAACRQLEQERLPAENRLFEDPWAAIFAGKYGRAFLGAVAEAAGAPAGTLADYVAVRTRFLDDILLVALKNGIRQVVLPGVGGDSRPSRLAALRQPGVAVFELDLPEVMDERRRVFSAHTPATPQQATLSSTSCDLSGDGALGSALRGAGFVEEQRCCVVAEGLLMYLQQPQLDTFLEQLQALCSGGSVLAADMVSGSFRSHPMNAPLLDVWNHWAAPVVSGHDAPEELLQRYGWTDVQVRQFGEPSLDYGRVSEGAKAFWAERPRTTHTDLPRNFLCTAVKA